MKKKAFTLIELIAVLVILAILALIVTPLVMNIIKKSKIAADKRSVDGYGRALELAVAEYSLDTGKYPTSIDMVEPKYKGNTVVCDVRQLKENGDVYLSKCKVNGRDVKDSKTDDGWYHYGTRDLTNEDYIDMYGKAVEEAVRKYYNDNNKIPVNMFFIDVNYEGKDVDCDIIFNFDTTVYMTNCEVKNIKILNDQEKDGYYHYGKKKLSGEEYVNMYGNAIEQAITNYYNTNNSYPNDISNLEINYSGEELVCESSINYNGTVYLTKCSTNGFEIKDSETEDGYYHYRQDMSNKPYSIGDLVNYKNEYYYVIENSGSEKTTVSLLKKYPLTVSEVNTYGAGHINKYTYSSVGVTYDIEGYGGIAYYSSTSCGYPNGTYTTSNCSTNYEQSDIKYVVDAWAQVKTNSNDIIEARLIKYEELVDNLGYEVKSEGTIEPSSSRDTPAWVYNNDYSYWTMSKYQDSNYRVWYNGHAYSVFDYYYVVRPVIVIKKSAIN